MSDSSSHTVRGDHEHTHPHARDHRPRILLGWTHQGLPGVTPCTPGRLVREIVAYAADEAESSNGGHCRITLHSDGSVAIADDGRGTDTRLDEHDQVVKKPVMATKDLRLFDHTDTPPLPDTHPRRGMYVVAALSTWLVHTNRRRNGSWTQRYDHGVPTTDLEPITDDGTTGTVVRFLPDEPLRTAHDLTADDLARLAAAWPQISCTIDDRRTA